MQGNKPRSEEYGRIPEFIEGANLRDSVATTLLRHTEEAIALILPYALPPAQKALEAPAQAVVEEAEVPEAEVVNKKPVASIEGIELYNADNPMADGMPFEAPPPPALPDLELTQQQIYDIFEENEGRAA